MVTSVHGVDTSPKGVHLFLLTLFDYDSVVDDITVY